MHTIYGMRMVIFIELSSLLFYNLLRRFSVYNTGNVKLKELIEKYRNCIVNVSYDA